jgi:hypothetical protein
MHRQSTALATASLLIVIGVFSFGVSAADEEREHNRCPQRHFGQFSDWSEPVNLGSVVNSEADDFHPAISPNGLSLYISSGRTEGLGSIKSLGGMDIWVSQRASLDDAWGPPQNLGPNINTAANEIAPDFTPDGHHMFFSRGAGQGAQIWVAFRKDVNDDFGWEPAVNLGPDINVPGLDDNAPTFFHDHRTGLTSIYFNSSKRMDGPGDFDIYVSTQREDSDDRGFVGTFGPAVLVPELSSPQRDTRTAIRRDGLEMFITSARPGGSGGNALGNDVWFSTRATTLDPWSTPVNLGTINSAFDDGGPALSCDGTTFYFYSTRPRAENPHRTDRDLYVTTRHRIDGEDRENDGRDDRVHRRGGR